MDEQEELDRLFDEHVAWYEENLRIITKESGVVPFKLKNAQKVLERYKWDCMRAGKPCWLLVLKGRQIGISTWAAATLFRDARENSNRRSLSIAHDDEATSHIFGITKFYHDNLPDEVPLEKSNRTELHFEDTNSVMRVRTAGAKGSVGRASTLQGAHLSELDKWPFPEELYQGLMPAIPSRGTVVVIAESTADGPMLLMNQLWDEAIEGKSEYMPFFFPWWTDDDYVRELTFEDLRKYAPREWVTQKKMKIRNAERRDKGKAERYGMEPDDLYGRRVLADPEYRLTGGASQGHPAPKTPGSGGSGSSPSPAAGESGGSSASPGESQQQETLGVGGYVHSIDPQSVAGRVSFAIRQLGGMSGDVRSKGTPFRAKLPEDRGSPSEGWDTVPTTDYHGGPMDLTADLDSELESLFRESMTSYEIGVAEEFDLTLQQINWRRYALGHICKWDETKCRREYPSRDSEAFEASGKDILDPRVLAEWAKDAKDSPFLERGYFKTTLNTLSGVPIPEWVDDVTMGKIEIYEWPKRREADSTQNSRYVAFLDPSTGVEGSDWQVCYVMNVETGDQAAEFRSTTDPDQVCDQVEALCIFYGVNRLGIEVSGGYGLPFIKHFVDRKTVPLYERQAWHKWTKQYLNVPGFDTNTKTRPMMVSESKEAVRNRRCKIRSEMTIRECRTLYESPTGKVEARPPNHDDGWMAYCGCLILRNQEISGEKMREETDRKSKSIVRHLNQLDRKLEKSATLKNLISRTHLKKKIVGARPHVRPDGRRSWV